MVQGKLEQTQILKGLGLEEQAFNLNFSFSLNQTSFIKIDKDISMDIEEENFDKEQCPSPRLSAISLDYRDMPKK